MPNEIGDGPGVKGISKDTKGRGAPASNSSAAGGFGTDGGVKGRGGRRGSPATPSGQPSSGKSDSGAPQTGSGSPSAGPGDGGGVKGVGQSGSGRGMPGAAPPPASMQPPALPITAQPQTERTLANREIMPSLRGRNEQEKLNERGLDNQSPQPFGSA